MSGVNWTIDEERKLEELCIGEASFKKMERSFPGRTAFGLQLKAKRLGLSNPYVMRKHYHNESFWDLPNLENSYWAGFCAADSSITEYGSGKGHTFNLELSQTDLSHLELFKQTVDYSGPILFSNRVDKKTCYIRINSIGRWQVYLDRWFSITPRKTHTLQPPNIEEEFQWAYLIGYIDGDGCIYKNSHGEGFSISFVSASEPILQWIDSKCRRFRGRRNTTRSVSKHNNYFTFALGWTGAAVLFDFLSKFAVPRLVRKWQQPAVLEYVGEQKQRYPELFIHDTRNLV